MDIGVWAVLLLYKTSSYLFESESFRFMAAYSPAFPPAVFITWEKKIIDKNGIRTIGLRVERPDFHCLPLNKSKGCKLKYRISFKTSIPTFALWQGRLN